MKLDEELLRETLISEDGGRCTPWGLDAAGCPPWLVRWLHNAWWAKYREDKVETDKPDEPEQPDDLAAWLAVNVMDMHLAVGLGGPAGYWTFRDLSRPGFRGENWNPLHNDAQAQQVKQRMVELKWQCHQHDITGWCDCTFDRADSNVSGQGRSPRIARSICRAAKAAIEAERAQKKPKVHTCNAMPDFCEFVAGFQSWRLEIKCEGHRTSSGLARDECPFCGEQL